jgi:hypothetical protein
MSRAVMTLTTIRIRRPDGKYGRWIIEAYRGDRVAYLAGRDLRQTIWLWRYGKRRVEEMLIGAP